MKPRVSAVIPTLDRPELLRTCLVSLAAAEPPFAQVIVADQSAARSAGVAAPGVTTLRLTARGISRARNAGLEQATGDWVYFPDDDCTVPPDVLARFEAVIASQPEAVFVSARVVSPAGRALMPSADGRARRLHLHDDVLRTVMSPGLFVRRDTLAELGGFDEDLGVGARYPSGEESDLLFRILESGRHGWYEPSLTVTHPEPFEVRDARAQAERAYQYGRGWGALFAKHAGREHYAFFLMLWFHYLQRAAYAALFHAVTLRWGMAARYRAILRGRWRGWGEYRRGLEF